MTKGYLTDLTYSITEEAIVVHKALGPGLRESVYHKCLKHELDLRKIQFRSELKVPLNFKGLELNLI